MTDKIVAGIVLYNPSIDIVASNVDTLLSEGAKVALVDNGSANITEIQSLALVRPNVRLIENGKNLGVAHALNQIAHEAIDGNAPFFLTLDQDSVVPEGLLRAYIDRLKKENLHDVAVLCPRTRDVNSGKLSGSQEDEFVERCITSGSLNRTEAYKDVGGFDDWLFIDEVDHDYCCRLADREWKILRVSSVVMEHSMGRIVTKRAFGVSFPVRNYSAFRKYYQARNRVVMARRHGRESVAHALLIISRWLLEGLLFESDRRGKFHALLRGTFDGLRSDCAFRKSPC